MELNSCSPELYRIYRIPKFRDGKRIGWRIIEEPNPDLKEIQRDLLKKFHREVKLHRVAHGVVGKSAVDNAEKHIGKTILIKVDLSDFFPNTYDWMIIQGFESINRIWPGTGDRHKNVRSFREDILFCMLNEGKSPHRPRLPQGAPTSPFLANVAFHPYDKQLEALAKSFSLTYTRYVDDLTFSGKYRPAGFISEVSNIVAPYRINVKKIDSLHKAYQSQEITGVVVNVKSSVPKGRRKIIRSKLDHFARDNKQLDDKILGELSYVRSVSPSQWATLMRHYEKRKEFYASKTIKGSPSTD